MCIQKIGVRKQKAGGIRVMKAQGYGFEVLSPEFCLLNSPSVNTSETRPEFILFVRFQSDSLARSKGFMLEFAIQ